MLDKPFNSRENMNSQNVIIAFDLHSVLFKPNWKEIAHILWQYNNKLSIIACAFNPKLVYKGLQLLAHNPTDEEVFAFFETFCPKLMPLAVDLMNAQRIVPAMAELVKELKNKGYALHIMSNIGPRRYPVICSRFADIMSLFEQAKIINYDHHTVIKKPNPQYFKDYLQSCNPEHKPVIFIDDNKKNIKAAQEFGFVGIRFKQPEQLRAQLKNMNIL
jgi:FMN phosphatase YigB (HAD superfamily)